MKKYLIAIIILLTILGVSKCFSTQFTNGATRFVTGITIFTNTSSGSTAPTPDVGWWKMNEGTGTTTVDSTVNGNTGTLHGTSLPTWVTGESGGLFALSFDATLAQYVDTTLTSINYSSGSISCWIKPSTAYNVTPTPSKVFWAQNYGGGGTIFSAEIYSDSNWYVGWSVSGGTDYRVSTAANATDYINGSWGLLIFTWGPSGSNLYIYNSNWPSGHLIGTNATAPIVANIGTDFLFGGAPLSPSGFFPGVMDDLGIYSHELSVGERAALYAPPGSR